MKESPYFAQLRQREKENLWIMEVFSRLLRQNQPLFSVTEIQSFAKEAGLSQSDAFFALISAACGLEPDQFPDHRRLERNYLRPALKQYSENELLQNDYLCRLRFPKVSRGDWQFTQLSYQPFELFPCGSPNVFSDGRVIPQIGYLPLAVSFPAVLEQGREWMAIKPNEIATMANPLSDARGRVAVFGLGLGYFAFMASEKNDVTAVTVIERDPAVINLFQEHLLPQFPCKEKIRFVNGDAYDFLRNQLKADDYDFAFFDLWHDVSDGVDQYLRLRKMEIGYPRLPCRYWIEEDILLFLRSLMLDDYLQSAGRLERLLPREKEELHALSLPYVRKAALQITPEDLR